MSRITVTVEGGLLPDDLLERIADGSAPGQRAADFGLASGRLSDEIMRAFSDSQSYWTAFRHRHERASKSGRESVTTITRESFVIPLLEALGYKLEFKRSLTAGDQSFVISHTSGDEPTAPPVNIVGADDKLDERGSSRRSAHSSVQEYLNVSDCLWGIATNGNKLRVMRDSSRLAKPRYIEFDLEGMMESNVFSDFHLLYRLLHRTRLPHSSADASECWLEKYYQDGIEQGSRVRDRLRDGVVEALNLFGNAFLAHPQSEYLRKRIAAGELTGAAYYRELLRLVYRLLFLMVAEERRLMFPDSRENERRRTIFSEHYGVNRLRARAEHYIGDDPEIDLWESLKQAFLILRDDRAAHALGMAALNGELFGPHGCPHLDGGGDPEQSAFCSNHKLLQAIHSLSTFDDEGTRRRVNFGALDVEELGSVYESLLEYHPQLSLSPQSFDLVTGSERKTTGSYYTPPDLVRELINSALVPLMEDRLRAAKTKEDREKEILLMRVIDPAAGSGHFLLAAARRMGRELAKIRTGEEEPPPSAFRHAVRDVIRECIYAVDKNPLAVDLCKVALWIEGHNAGQPLSFLDHHVKCGDSLLGVFDLKVLEEGVPDDAYNAVEGDDKAAAKFYRKRNKDERESGQLTLSPRMPPASLVTGFETLRHRDELTPEDVAAKEREYATLVNDPTMQNLERACNAWTAAFLVLLQMPEFRGRDLVPTSSTVKELLAGRQIYGLLDGEITKARFAHSFFHWPLEFPDVFAHGGFDVVLGNPPWERIKIADSEFFAHRYPNLSAATDAASKKRVLSKIRAEQPDLWNLYTSALRAAEAQSNYLRKSGRYPLCGVGDVNTYALFAELAKDLVSSRGFAGLIVPSGIATDKNTAHFFSFLTETRRLKSLYDFENRERVLFPSVYYRMRFCLLTLAGGDVSVPKLDLVFQAYRVEDLRNQARHFSLSSSDIALLNPDTRTCPMFLSTEDAEVTLAIFRPRPLLGSIYGTSGDGWGLTYKRLFDMGTDAEMFRGAPNGFGEGIESVSLYEGRMIGAFNHRVASMGTTGDNIHRTGVKLETDPADLLNPGYFVSTRFFVEKRNFIARLPKSQKFNWFLTLKDITSATNARTVIAAIIPFVAAGHTCPLLLIENSAPMASCLLANLNSFALDFTSRKKVSGNHLTLFVLKQLPFLRPSDFTNKAAWDTTTKTEEWVCKRVLELTYTAWDLEPFAKDCGCSTPPFCWTEERRFLLQSELDAAFFHLYLGSISQWQQQSEALTKKFKIPRDAVSYIMETFPIVKTRDEERFGEYRTKRVILEIYDAMADAIRTGHPYQTRLDPPPSDPRAAHVMTSVEKKKEDTNALSDR